MPTKKARIAELNETTGAICASAFRQYTTSLWSQGPNGDVTVTNTDPKTRFTVVHRAHSFLLASSSTLFAAMLSPSRPRSPMNPTSPRSQRNSSCAGAFAEARTRVIELTHETGAWLAALKFMYTHTLHFDVGDGTTQSPASKALACFRLADYLGADCLSLACVEWMREFVSPANCCLLFASGLDMRDTFLASSIVAIATDAIGTCISYEPTRDAFWDCFARLSASHMRDLVRSHDLKVISESALLDAVVFWAESAECAGASAGVPSGRTDRTDRTDREGRHNQDYMYVTDLLNDVYNADRKCLSGRQVSSVRPGRFFY